MSKEYKRGIRDTLASIGLLICMTICFIKAMLIILI